MLYLLLASLVWALSFGIIKTSLAGLDPGFVGWARLLLSVALFAPFVGGPALSERRLCGHLFAIGAVQYGLMYCLYLAAYARLDAHQIAIFTVFTPIYVVLWSDLRARRLRPLGLLCAGLAVIGAALLSEHDLGDGQLVVGFSLVQAANLCFAVGQIEYRRLRLRRPELRDRQVHVLLLLGGLAITGLATTLRGGWPELADLNTTALAALAYLGLVASGVGFFAWNAGAVRTAPATLAVLNNLKIPLGIAAALLLFGEETDLPRLFLGGSIMLGAAWLSQRASSDPRPSETDSRGASSR